MANQPNFVTSASMARHQHLDPRAFERRCEKIGIQPDAFILEATGPKALFDCRRAGEISARLAAEFPDHLAKAFDATDPYAAHHGVNEG